MGYDAMANHASSPAVAREAKKKRVRGELDLDYDIPDWMVWRADPSVLVVISAGEPVGEAEAEQARRAPRAVAVARSDLAPDSGFSFRIFLISVAISRFR
jgi:hypothetical protein